MASRGVGVWDYLRDLLAGNGLRLFWARDPRRTNFGDELRPHSSYLR